MHFSVFLILVSLNITVLLFFLVFIKIIKVYCEKCIKVYGVFLLDFLHTYCVSHRGFVFTGWIGWIWDAQIIFYHLYAQPPAAFSTERLQKDDKYRNDKSHQSFPEMGHILFLMAHALILPPFPSVLYMFLQKCRLCTMKTVSFWMKSLEFSSICAWKKKKASRIS